MTQLSKTFSRPLISLMIVWLFIIGLLVTPLPTASAADCVATLAVEQFPNGSGPPNIYDSSTTVQFSSGDKFVLHYTLANCNQAVIQSEYKLYIGDSPSPREQGIADNLDKSLDLVTPNGNGSSKYSLKVTPGRASSVTTPIATKEFIITYTNPSNPPNPPTNTTVPTNTTIPTNTTAPSNTNGNQPGSPAIDVVIPPINGTPGTFLSGDLSKVVLQVIKVLLLLIIIAAVVVIVVAGFRMVAGAGNPEQVKKAKNAIVWAIIGVIVALMSYSIIGIVQRLL